LREGFIGEKLILGRTRTRLPYCRLWYTKPDDAGKYATFFSQSHDAVIRVYDAAGNVIETHELKGEFKKW